MPKKRTNKKKNKDTKNIKKRRYQKKMGNDYEIMSKHENDCAACVLKYFGDPQEVIDQVTSSSEYDPLQKQKVQQKIIF